MSSPDHFQFPRRGNGPETALISTAAFLLKPEEKEGLPVDGFPVFHWSGFLPGLGSPSMSVVSGARH
jgi:hypothetical protein